MISKRFLLGMLVCLCWWISPAAFGQQNPSAPLLLIGIDGLRWDIIDRHSAPNLRRLAQEGVRAQGLIPVMPSKTFPNFYAIATGLYPEHNGVLDNTTYDEVLETTFRMSNQDDARWFEGEPIWSTAEAQGVRAATMFWVGSGVKSGGRRPSYWHPFDDSVPNEERVAQVLAWLDLPAAERPRFLSVYFEAVDSASHEYGVDSPEEAAALTALDATLGVLLEGLTQRGLRDQINLVVVGDHGMTNLSAERIIYLDDYADLGADFSNLYSPQLSGERQGNAVFAGFHGEASAVDSLYQALALAHPHLSVYREAQFPEWFHQDHPQRSPDLILMPDNGWLVSKRAVPFNGPAANHGYSPQERDMHAAFIASGPAFASNLVVEPFEVVQLYNLMCRLLGITPAANDGQAEALEHILLAR